MAGYAAENYVDLVTTTLRNMEETTWEDIVLDEQELVAMPQVLRQENVKFGSGRGWQFNIRVATAGNARNVRLGQTDNPVSADVMKTGTLEWRHTETKWTIEERILKMNRDPARLVDLMETSKVDALTSLASQLETNWWNKPDSSSDDLKPNGVPYHLVKNATEGFTGGHASGFSDWSSLSRTTYARLKNWSAQYAAFSKTDLIRKWRKAATFTVFRPPVPYPRSSGAPAPRWAFYTTYVVIRNLEEILESQNDNLGSDLATYDGDAHFRRTPVKWVPYLDNNDSTNPVYGINWKTWKIAFLSGEYMNEGEVIRVPDAHRTIAQYTDNTYQFFCHNPRANFVLYQ